ncbi:putative sugar O-methyltransferase [Hwanghaeella sp.]|uniref:putative sugar O-methyltransferase n=1 Tax=Hwanghaeella sp. TaxID=2605943 RepID=UPI003CCBF903
MTPTDDRTPTTRDRAPNRARFCYFRDQTPLSDTQLARARSALATVRSFMDLQKELEGDDFVTVSPLWTKVTDYAAGLVAGEKDALERLRFLSWPFSGISLLHMSTRPEVIGGQTDYTDPDAALAQFEARGLDLEMTHALDAAEQFSSILPITLPRQMGEVGWLGPHGVVNLDTIAFSERVAVMAEFGAIQRVMQQTPRQIVVEIGGGFGGLAYILKRALPGLQYVIVDLPSSMAFSAAYLSAMMPDARIAFFDGRTETAPDEEYDFLFVPHYAWDDLVQFLPRADLGLNTLSFAEMTEAQVDGYGRGLADLLPPDGLLFEQNFDDRRRGGLNVPDILSRHLKDVSPADLGPILRGVPKLWAPKPN